MTNQGSDCDMFELQRQTVCALSSLRPFTNRQVSRSFIATESLCLGNHYLCTMSDIWNPIRKGRVNIQLQMVMRHTLTVVIEHHALLILGSRGLEIIIVHDLGRAPLLDALAEGQQTPWHGNAGNSHIFDPTDLRLHFR